MSGIADRIKSGGSSEAGKSSESSTPDAKAVAEAKAKIPSYDEGAPSENKPQFKSTPPGSGSEYEFSDSELEDLLSEDGDEDVTGIPPAADHEEEDVSQAGDEVTEELQPGAREEQAATSEEELQTPPATERSTEETEAQAATPPDQAAEQQVAPGQTEQQTQQTEQPKAKTQEELQAEWNQAREQLLQSLESEYAISEEDASNLITEPETVLPKLMARLHTNVLAQMAQGMATQLPAMIHNLNQQKEAKATYDNMFYSKWGDLKGHEDLVNRVSAMYQQLNPTATVDDAINEIGAQVMVMLRKPIKGQPMAVDQQGGQTQPSSAPPPPPPPPASVGGSATPKPAPVNQDNLFSQMAEEMLEEGDI